MKTTRIDLIALSVLLLLLLVAACGGDDDDTTDTGDEATTAAGTATGSDGDDDGDSGSDEPTDASNEGDSGEAVHACDLITAEEVSTAVGFDVQIGSDYLATAPGATQCEWPGTVYAEVLTEGGADWYETVTFGDSPSEEATVAGADQAIYKHGAVQAVSGDNYVAVQIIGAGFAGVDEVDAGSALAAEILAKLK